MWVIDGERNHNGASLLQIYLGDMALRARRFGIVVLPLEFILENSPYAMYARINHNNWIVDCPFPHCGGAEFVWLKTPQFMCQNCFNQTIKGLWLPVNIPNVDNIAKIHEILEKRPVPQTRNWHAWESIESLQNENIEHGII